MSDIKKFVILAIALCLGACSAHPTPGFADGQVVYMRAICQKAMIVRWDAFVGMYSIETQHGNYIHVDPVDISSDASGCINWGKP